MLDHPTPGASILNGCVVSESDGAPLPIRIAGRHLRALGATRADGRRGGVADSNLLVAHLSSGRKSSLRCSLAASNGGGGEASCEALVQALSGLMAVHGRDVACPRRLGLDVASTAAGILMASGALAGLIANARGGAGVRAVETSVMHGALAYLGHHI